MFRFFSISQNQIVLSPEDKHHLINVNRIKKGEKFEIVFNNEIHLLEVVSIKPFETKILTKYSENSELPKQITIIFALSKGDKNELVVQKCCELGASKIIFVPSDRSIVKYDQNQILKKQIRFQNIAKEAAMQSHRLIIPEVSILASFNDVDKYASDLNYLAYEKESKNNVSDFSKVLNNNIKSISIYIGSEGGISEKEVGYLLSKGFSLLSLGNRILRCETAALYAMAVVSNMLEK